MYIHATDSVGVGQCRGNRSEFHCGKNGREPCGYRFKAYFGRKAYRQWMRDRVRADLLLHLLHSMGVIRWVR